MTPSAGKEILLMPAETVPAFQINEYIFHGGSGVCVVEDICVPENMRRINATRKYYCLKPLYDKNSVIYTPVDNTGSMVRKLLSREEALELIRRIPGIEALPVENEKGREELYRTALRTNNCYEWIRMIKTLHLRGEARRAEHKNLNQVDEKYLHLVEELLYGELSIPLGIPREQVREYITEQVSPLVRAESRYS